MSRTDSAPFTGVVLTGGFSKRLGEDKSLVEVQGRALAAIVASALRDAGAVEVVAAGGDAERLLELGAFDRFLVDDHPGDGPLGGLITALGACSTPTAVVLACDTPEITSDTPRMLVDALGDLDVAVGVVDGRDQPLTAAWRCDSALAMAHALFAAGERAPRTLLGLLRCVRIDLDAGAVRDVDRREDLARYAPGADRMVDGGTPMDDDRSTQ